MDEVIYYLELKNQYYEKFHNITARFLEQANEDRWDDLEFFVDNRERILNIIRSFDFRIAKIFNSLKFSNETLETYRNTVHQLFERREFLADKIVKQDLELIAKIDEMKSDTIKELKRTLESTQQLGTFDATTRKTSKHSREV